MTSYLRSSYCSICRVPLSGPEPARQHYAGKKHAKMMPRVRGLQFIRQTLGEDSALPTASGDVATSSGGAAQDSRRAQSKNTDGSDEGSSDVENGSHDDEYRWNGDTGWCCVCKVWFTSLAVAQQHLDGQRHHRALQLSRWLKARGQDSAVTSFFCEVCFKSLNTAEQLALHRQSPAHLKMEARKSWSLIIERGGVPGDNTDWETCPVCRKQVNSTDQLFVHLRSHDAAYSSRLNLEHTSKASHGSTISHHDGKSHNLLSRLSRWDRIASRAHSESSSEQSLNPSKLGSVGGISDDELDLAGGLLGLTINQARISSPPAVTPPPFGPQYRFYCPLCMVPFDTLQTKLEHERGKQHAAKALRRTTAPARNLPDVKISTRVGSDGDDCSSLTKTTPRPYQVELYEAVMKNDSICFLPTGTGKTLVSAMVISRMLQLNPHHSAVFLVDKVLLAVQQSKVMRYELGEKMYRRWNRSTNSISSRRLRIAMLCGQKEDLKGVEVWEHDVIVVTSACYSNLLDKKAVRWTDNCVAVFDEVHHCHDEHPYRKLMQQTEHAWLCNRRRPKLLGLTASPAGKDTVPQTETALRKLLKDFGAGETKLVRVKRNKDDLTEYQSSAELKIVNVEYSAEELKLRPQLERCVTNACQRLLERSERMTIGGEGEGEQDECTRIEWLMRNLVSTITSKALCPSESHLDIRTVETIVDSVRNVKDKYASSTSTDVEIIGRYLRVVGRSLVSLSAEGIDSALHDLDDLWPTDVDEEDKDEPDRRTLSRDNYRQRQFDTVCRRLELPGFGVIREAVCRVSSSSNDSMYVHRHTVIQRNGEDDAVREEFDLKQISPKFKRLVEELVLWWDSAATSRDRIALILVNRRVVASTWSSQLDQCDQLRSRRMRVVHLVGHGGGKRKSDDQHATSSGCDGMTVSRQSRVIEEIWKREYNVVVATSVAEEGIDLPECDLVVRLDAPDCVRALVQVRGRARRRGGKFVVLCRESSANLNRLLKQERNMEQAVDLIVRQQQDDD